MARNIAPQDVTWFLDLNERKRLDLSPPYQRRSVWSPKERRYFLDTIFSGYPCPPLFLYKSISDTGISTFHVVDGKQRLETVINFTLNKLSIPAEYPNKELAGKKWRQLNVDQKKQFWNYQFAVEMLDVVDPAVVKEIFGRYNRTSKNLEPQELRHAKYDGWFINTAEDEAKKAEWSRLGISTTARARRMRDVQFISELMIAVLNEGQPFGFDQDLIDDYYANYEVPAEYDSSFSEEDFINKFENVKQIILQMEDASQAITAYGKSHTHFYSLWNVLASGKLDLSKAAEYANKYSLFMQKVNIIMQAKNPQEYLEGENANTFAAPFSYSQAARGANTDEPQRKQRFEILLSELETNK